MAKSKKSTAVEEVATKPEGITRVLERDVVQPNWKAFSAFIEENGGPKINPKHVGIVLTGYKFYQRSDAAAESREAAQEAKAERDAARKARAAKRAEAVAAKKAAPATKATPASKTKAAAKKAAAAKPAAKRKGKAETKAAF